MRKVTRQNKLPRMHEKRHRIAQRREPWRADQARKNTLPPPILKILLVPKCERGRFTRAIRGEPGKA